MTNLYSIEPLGFVGLNKKNEVIEIDEDEYVRQAQDIQRRRVGRAEFGNASVSTVFILANHGTREHPLYFETMVFSKQYQDILERYPNWWSAEKGHKFWCTVLDGFRGRNEKLANYLAKFTRPDSFW